MREVDNPMLQAVWGVIRNGKIELLEPLDLPEGTKVIVTTLVETDAESQFWLNASTASLDKIWNNPEDDIYGRALESSKSIDSLRVTHIYFDRNALWRVVKNGKIVALPTEFCTKNG
jgi:hypothetical protein